MLSRILARRCILPKRTYTIAGHGNNNSWYQLWAETGKHGAELYLLTVYMVVAGSMMLYQTCFATTFKKTEITTLPYLSKDYNTAGSRVSWTDNRHQHTFTHSKDQFWAEQGWKEEVQALLDEIHAE